MVFTGGMPLGLFKSERTHTITPGEGGQATFHTEEIFSGLLLPVFGRTIPDLNENFAAFAAGLKRQAKMMRIKNHVLTAFGEKMQSIDTKPVFD